MWKTASRGRFLGQKLQTAHEQFETIFQFTNPGRRPDHSTGIHYSGLQSNRKMFIFYDVKGNRGLDPPPLCHVESGLALRVVRTTSTFLHHAGSLEHA
jgi:hypothetical protein